MNILTTLKDAALMLERTPTKGGVTELGAENCRKAIATLDSLEHVDGLDEALESFDKEQLAIKHLISQMQGYDKFEVLLQAAKNWQAFQGEK